MIHSGIEFVPAKYKILFEAERAKTERLMRFVKAVATNDLMYTDPQEWAQEILDEEEQENVSVRPTEDN